MRERVSTPIAADEAVVSAEDVRRAVELGACDVVNVKLAGCGGFGPAREALREARSHGVEAFLSSTLDGPWGIAAALQLAAAEELTLACGLATLGLFDARVAEGAAGAAARHAVGAARPGPGRGGGRRGAGRGAGGGDRPLARAPSANSATSARHRLRLLQVGRVAGVLHQGGAAGGSQAGHPLGGARVALVAHARPRPAAAAPGARARATPGRARPARPCAAAARARADRGSACRGAAPPRARRTGPRTAAGAPTPPRSRRSASSPSTPPAARPPRARELRATGSSMPAEAPIVITPR